MAGSSLLGNLARAAKVIALLLFFLPWVAVSCSPDAMERVQSAARENAPASAQSALGSSPSITIATASGLQMAMGSISMVNPAGAMAPRGGTESGNADQAPQLSPEIGVIAGAALLILGLVATFLLKGSGGSTVGAGASLLAAVAFCYSVFIHYPPAVIAAFAAGRQGSNATSEQVAQILSVKPEAGFYFVLIALALAILFNVMAMKKSGAAPAPAAAAPAPPPVDPPAAV